MGAHDEPTAFSDWIAGKATTVGPGSVAFMASEQEHGFRNVAETRAKYALIALGPDQTSRHSVGCER